MARETIEKAKELLSKRVVPNTCTCTDTLVTRLQMAENLGLTFFATKIVSLRSILLNFFQGENRFCTKNRFLPDRYRK